MIKNDRQYGITKKRAEEFKAAIDVLKSGDSNLGKELLQLQLSGLESQYQDLIEEIEEYSLLKNGSIQRFECPIEEFPKVLIKGRVLRGLTQKQMATKLKLKEQQIQKYEAEDYSSASFSRMLKIVAALDLSIALKCVTNRDRQIHLRTKKVMEELPSALSSYIQKSKQRVGERGIIFEMAEL